MSRIFTVHQLDFDGSSSLDEIVSACREAHKQGEKITLLLLHPSDYLFNYLLNNNDIAYAKNYWCESSTIAMQCCHEFPELVFIEMSRLESDKFALLIGYFLSTRFEGVGEVFNKLQSYLEEPVSLVPDASLGLLVKDIKNEREQLLLLNEQLTTTQNQLEEYFLKYQSSLANIMRLEEGLRKSKNRAEDLKRQKHVVIEEMKTIKLARDNSEGESVEHKKQTTPLAFLTKIMPGIYKRIFKKGKGKGNPRLAEIKLLEESQLFDEKFYISKYPDIKNASISPAEHYYRFGWVEGRNPSAKFNTQNYLDANPDVKEQSINPLVHFEKFGRRELRPLKAKK